MKWRKRQIIRQRKPKPARMSRAQPVWPTRQTKQAELDRMWAELDRMHALAFWTRTNGMK